MNFFRATNATGLGLRRTASRYPARSQNGDRDRTPQVKRGMKVSGHLKEANNQERSKAARQEKEGGGDTAQWRKCEKMADNKNPGDKEGDKMVDAQGNLLEIPGAMQAMLVTLMADAGRWQRATGGEPSP